MNCPVPSTSRKRASSSGISGANCALTSTSGICMATHSSGLDPPVEEIRREQQNACNDRVLGVLEAMVEALVAPAEAVARAGDAEGPHRGADNREEAVGRERHLEDAGRDRHERAYDRRHAADEDAEVAPLAEPALRSVEPLRREVEPPAAPLEERTPAVAADAPADQRAGEVAERAGERQRDERRHAE